TAEAFASNEVALRPLRKPFYRKMGRHGSTEAEVQVALEGLDLTLKRMEGRLTQGCGPWLMGEAFSLADILVLPTADRMDDLGLSQMWSGSYPCVCTWYARIRERPSYPIAFYEGSRRSTRFKIDRTFTLPVERSRMPESPVA